MEVGTGVRDFRVMRCPDEFQVTCITSKSFRKLKFLDFLETLLNLEEFDVF